MTTTMPCKVALDGPDLASIVRRAVTLPAFAGRPEVRVDVDPPARAGDDWVERALADTTVEMFATWGGDYTRFVSLHAGDVVQLAIPDLARDPRAALELLAPMPFEVASFATIHPSWPPGYEGPSFGGYHFPLGWACAFRGEGHRRLVSRRWLERGPWKVWRGDGDLTLIQFHDLEADAATALAQARAAHPRFDPIDGGYLSPALRTETSLRGLYDPATQTMRIVVAGRDVDARELLDACAVRARGGGDPNRPIRSIAYLFLDEAAGRRWVDELWFRELECWTLVNGRERRLDLDDQPPAAPRSWDQT